MNGRELKRWRHEQFLSQTDLAALLGVNYTTIANWEKGRARPPYEMLDLACEAISQRRERQVRALRRAKEKLAHQRHLKEIAQGIPERRAAAKAAATRAARNAGLATSSRPIRTEAAS